MTTNITTDNENPSRVKFPTACVSAEPTGKAGSRGATCSAGVALATQIESVVKPNGTAAEPETWLRPSPQALRRVKVKIKNPKIKVTIPDEIQAGNGENKAWQPRTAGFRLQAQDFLVAGGSVVLLIAVLVMGYLRFVKGVDVFKPARNRMATASYVLFRSGDHVVIERDDLNYLISDSNKSAKSVQQTDAIQTDGLATGDSNMQPTATVALISPKSPAVDKGEEEDESVELAQQSNPLKSSPIVEEEQKSSEQAQSSQAEQKQVAVPSIVSPSFAGKPCGLPQGGSAIAPKEIETFSASPFARIASADKSEGSAKMPRGTSPETDAGDNKLASLTKRAENGDAKALCELGDYYDSINDKESALEWYRRSAEQNLPKGLCRYGDCLARGVGTQKNEIEAVEMFKKAAALNDPEGQCKLANCLLKGQGVPRNPAAAVEMFQYAAGQTNAESYCRLGDCALAGNGMNKNINKALAHYKKAAALNYSPAYCRMAEAYRKGLFGAVNPTMALALYKKAAEMNNIEAKCVLALQYYSHAKGAPQNSKEMIRWLNSVATNSFDEASDDEKIMLARIYLLYGDCLMNGTYMRKDTSAGATWYEKAAKAGDPDGLYKYGLCLLNGIEEGQKNETEACKLFARAAEANHAKAEWMLGECYLNGTGIDQDKIKAMSWFKKAAEQNVPEAQYWMGECCLNGIGVALSEKDAFAWFLKSAEAGYEEAIVKVIKCYKNGIGTEKDSQKATMWRNKLKRAGKM